MNNAPRVAAKIIKILLLVILAILFLLPFVIMLLGSLKPGLALNLVPIDLSPFVNTTLDNYTTLFSKVNIPRAFLNSLYIEVLVVTSEIVIGLTAGYVFATKKFRFSKLLFAVVIVTMMLPRQLLLIPNFMVAVKFNLVDSLTGVALTTINASYGIFLTRQRVLSIPRDYFDAARIDGCGEFRLFFSIVLPQIKSTVAAIAIYSVFNVWNDYLWQNIMLTSPSKQTVPILLAYLANTSTSGIPAIGMQLAGSVIAVVPVITFFIVAQKWFIPSSNESGIKD